MRRSRWLTAAALLVIAGVAFALVSRSDGPAPGPVRTATPTPVAERRGANLWVDASAADDRCTRSPARAGYVSTTACASLAAAYRAAHQGDVVLVKGGTYPAQKLGDDPSKHRGRCRLHARAACVTIRSAPGESVTLADLVSDGAWNAYYDGFHFPLGKRGAPADAGPTVKGGRWIVMADMRAASLYIASDGTQPAPRDVHYLRGDYGPRLDQCPGGGIKIGSDVTDDTNDPRLMPADITLERLRVHDFTVSRTCAGTHMDCVHVRDVKGYLHLVGNHFAHCQDYAILIDGNGPVPDDILVAGNVVGRNVSGTSSLALHGGAPSDEFNGSVVFRDNSADGLITAQTTNRLSGSIRFTHNNAPSVAPCRDGVSYAGNVTTQGPPCGRSDRLGALDWSARG